MFNYKALQATIARITEDKITELFRMADDFCQFSDAMMAKYTLGSAKKRSYHRDSTLCKAEVMLIMILFHDSGYRCLKHFLGDVDDRKPLECKKFIGLIYGKLIADKGYIYSECAELELR